MKRFLLIAVILVVAGLLFPVFVNTFYPFPSSVPGGGDEVLPYKNPTGYQSNSLVLRRPEVAFKSIPAKGLTGSVVSFDDSLIARMPPGGHIQGVQIYHHNGTKYMYLSHDSSETHPYFIIAEQRRDYLWEGSSVFIIDYDTEIYGESLRHVGGIQICDNYLVAGLEDNRGKKDSLIVFYDISDPINPVKLSNLTIERSSDKEKRKTAGAVGLVSYNRDGVHGYLVVVANWDSKVFDFYFIPGDLSELNNEAKFEAEPFYTWKSEERESENWIPDRGWGSYQSVNFVKDYNDSLYLFCTASSGKVLGRDYIDFFRVQIDNRDEVGLTKIDKKILNTGLYQPLSRNAHLIYGGGVFVRDDDSMAVLVTAGYIRENRLKIVVSNP